MKSDEEKATIVIAIWMCAFAIGLMIATKSRAIGFMLIISATAILAVYLHEDNLKDAEKTRRKRYEADCERRIKEAMNRDKERMGL